MKKNSFITLFIITIVFISSFNCLNDRLLFKHKDEGYPSINQKGKMFVWGDNSSGQFGNGNSAFNNKVNIIQGGQKWKKAVTADQVTIAINKDGTLWGWGSNSHNQLLGSRGQYSKENIFSPVMLSNEKGWKDIDIEGFSVVAIKNDGSMWTWGMGVYESKEPMRIGEDNDWDTAVVGASHIMALKKNGTLYLCGENYAGQLGDISIASSNIFRIFKPDMRWVKIATFNSTCCAISSEGDLWIWGEDLFHLNSTDKKYMQPVKIGQDKKWEDVSISNSHIIAKDKQGYFYIMGCVPQGISGKLKIIKSLKLIPNSNSWVTCNPGYGFSLAIDNEGKVYGWGFNRFGVLCNDKTEFIAVPEELKINKVITNVSVGRYNVVALTEDDELISWGANYSGELGWGAFYKTDKPFCYSKFLWRQVAIGYCFTIALRDDGTIWSCGDNIRNQMGFSDVFISKSFRQIDSNTERFKAISCGALHTIAITTKGELWGWGMNDKNQLSQYINRQQIIKPTLLDIKYKWKKIFAYRNRNIGIRQEGTLWIWGEAWKENGIGFTKIGDDCDWDRVFLYNDIFYAIKNDGSLWMGRICGEDKAEDIYSIKDCDLKQIYQDEQWYKIVLYNNQVCGLTQKGKAYFWEIPDSKGQYNENIKSLKLIGGNIIWIDVAYWKKGIYLIDNNNALFLCNDTDIKNNSFNLKKIDDKHKWEQIIAKNNVYYGIVN